MITEALGDLRDMDVREVMTPRMDVAALSIPVSAEDVVRAVRQSGHSAFPVVAGGLDDVVGVLYVNDLFRSRRSAKAGILSSVPADKIERPEAAASGESGARRPEAPPAPRGAVSRTDELEPEGLSPLEISRRIRQAYVIPESRRILAALVEMRRHRRGFAVVVDEYGGVAGVLTVKDLLEPIVGELHDELDPVDAEPAIVRVDGSRWLVDGRTNVDEVRERLGIEVPEGDYVTLGGYLFDGLGHIPGEGETLALDGWELTVQEMDKRRIAKVVARRAELEQLPPAVPQGAGPVAAVGGGPADPGAEPLAAALPATPAEQRTPEPGDRPGSAASDADGMRHEGSRRAAGAAGAGIDPADGTDGADRADGTGGTSGAARS